MIEHNKYILANNCYKLKDYEKAESLINQIDNGSKYYFEARFLLASICIEKNYLLEAIDELKIIILQTNIEDEINCRARNNLGISYIKVGDYKNALLYLSEIPDSFDTYYLAQYNIGISNYALKKYTEAYAAWEKIPHDNNRYGMAQVNLAICIIETDFDRAINILEKIPLTDSNYDKAQFNLGVAYASKKLFAKAKIALQNITKKSQFYLTALLLISEIYEEEKNSIEAEKLYKDFFSLNIENPSLLFFDVLKTLEQKYGCSFSSDKESIYKEKLFALESENNLHFFQQLPNCCKRPVEESKTQYILYQYMKCSEKTLFRILNNHLAFSNPQYFNDPYDPVIKAMENGTNVLKKLDFKVSCLTTDCKNLLMWSHYSDRHTGVCIAYDITSLLNNKNMVFRKINFTKAIENPHDNDTLTIGLNDTSLIDTFTTKHIDWDYEKEYRFITTLKEDSVIVPITEIYLGKDITLENKALIAKTLRKRKENIPIFQMKPSVHNIFELDSYFVNIDEISYTSN